MLKLAQGVHKFQSEFFGTKKELFERLADTQAPHTLFITCSDSRISPSLLTQTEPGEIFILRNAGNLIPAHGASTGGEAATIEFAVAGLGVENIVVCGHSSCGAMKALVGQASTDELPAMRQWLGNAEATRRTVRENYPDLTGDALLNVATQENVLVQLENLRTLPAVTARLARGKLHLHGWVYKIATGEVFAYDPADGQFKPLAELPRPTPSGRVIDDSFAAE